MALSAREQVVQEVILRLETTFPDVYIERGFAGVEIARFPSIFLFEGEESWELKKPGLYIRTLPIYLEYFTQRRDLATCIEDLDDVLQRLVAAMEVGSFFKDGLGVLNYSMVKTDMIKFSDTIMDLSCEWQFEMAHTFSTRR